MRHTPWLVLLLGCTPGPNPETKLYELRVVQIVAEPPEAPPGEVVTVTVTVADPKERGVELLVWTCSGAFGGAPCTEAELPVGLWTWTATPEDGTFEVALPISDLLTAFLETPDATLPIALHALACAPGDCPVIDDIRAAREGAGDAIADLDALLKDLPLADVSLATRLLTVSTRPEDERNQNPVVSTALELADLSGRDQARMRFEVDDDQDVSAWGFADGGGFEMPSYDVNDGEVRMTWFAPPKGGASDLYVAFEDGEGGAALWRGTVE